MAVDQRIPRGQPRSLDRASAALQNLSPGYIPFVMATSIISTAGFLLGPSWLSRVLLVIASAGLAVLGVAVAVQLVRFRPGLVAGFHDPGRVFGFFAIPAGINVLGIRLAAAGHPLATAILAGVAAANWLFLTCAVPASLLLRRSHDSVAGDVNGTWLVVLGIWRHLRHHWPLTYEPALLPWPPGWRWPVPSPSGCSP